MALFGIFLATLGWGASFFFVKWILPETGVAPFLVVRFGLSVLLFFILFPRKFLKASLSVKKKGGVLGTFLFLILWTQTLGLQWTTAGRSAFITSFYVPLTPFVGWILLGHTLVIRQLVVAFVAVIGLYLMAYEQLVGGALNNGDLWTVVTALLSAGHIVLTGKITREEEDSLALGIWQIIVCTVWIGIAAALSQSFLYEPTGNWDIRQWSFNAWVSIAFNVVVTTCFCFTIQIVCQKTVGAAKAALVFAMEAPIAAFLAYMFLGEMMGVVEIVGAAMIFVAGFIPEESLRGSL